MTEQDRSHEAVHGGHVLVLLPLAALGERSRSVALRLMIRAQGGPPTTSPPATALPTASLHHRSAAPSSVA